MKTRTPLSTFIHKNMHTTTHTHSWKYAHHSIQSFMKIHTQLDKLIHENTQKTRYTYSRKYLHHLAHLFIKISTRTPQTHSWKMREPFRTFLHNTHTSPHTYSWKYAHYSTHLLLWKTHSWKLFFGRECIVYVRECRLQSRVQWFWHFFRNSICFMCFWFGLEILRLVYKKVFYEILNGFYLIWPFIPRKK
jgi:hypothetical protein